MKGTIITILALLSASADAASITTLKRTSNWQLSYDERSCDLAATFGADSEQIFVMFSRYGPSDWFNLTVAGPIAKTSRLISDITVDFGPVENPRRVRALNGTVGSLPSTSITNLRLDDAEFQEDESELPGIKEEDEAKVDTVRLILRAKRVVQLQLGSMAKPMLAIRNCTDGLMKLWGLNPEEQKNAIAGPRPSISPRNWLQSSDYPKDMLLQGRSAIVRYRLDVNEAGRVAGCHSYTSEKAKQFGDMTCRLLSMRGRFSPALNHDGKPMRSFYIGTVNWLI